MLAEIMQRFLKKFRVKGNLFPNGDRRCVMIDAECQQLHNGDYRFDDVIIGGKNGVFGFSADWRCIWGFCLDFLPHTSKKLPPGWFSDGDPLGLSSGSCELLFGAIQRFFSIRPNA
jgi:hypothetical protein